MRLSNMVRRLEATLLLLAWCDATLGVLAALTRYLLNLPGFLAV